MINVYNLRVMHDLVLGDPLNDIFITSNLNIFKLFLFNSELVIQLLIECPLLGYWPEADIHSSTIL